MAAPDYSGITKGITGQFDVARQKAAQTEGANLQGQKDALARRAAQLGGGPSGAFVKAEQTAGNESAQRLQQANEGINSQQSAALRDVNMTQLGQQYQTSERLGSEQFASGERLGSQQFTSGENASNRDLTKYGIDTSTGLQKDIALGSIGGKDTIAKTSAASAAKLGEAALTGTLNGKATLAATTAADQHNLAVGGLTGVYGGKSTLAADALSHTFDQDKLEYDQNIKTSALNAVTALVAANYKGEDIKNMIHGFFPDFDFSSLGDIPGVTSTRGGSENQPAPWQSANATHGGAAPQASPSFVDNRKSYT